MLFSLRHLFIPFILLLAIGFGRGQNVRFEHLTTQEGLPENTGQAIIQDRMGFIWIGTQNGLCRFDGYSFKTYQNNPREAGSISNNFIEGLFEDRDGHLWVSTRSGLNRMDVQTERFERFYPDTSDYFGGNWLKYDICQTEDGSIWFMNANGVYEVRDWASRDIRFMELPGSPPKIHGCLMSSGNEVWVGKGKRLYRRENEKFVPIADVPSTINAIGFIEGELWVGGQSGVYIFNFETAELEELSAMKGKCSYQSFIEKDKNGTVWIGSENGVFWLREKRLAAHFKNETHWEESLSYNLVLDYFEDRQGLIWIGTGQGVNIFDPSQQQVVRLNSRNSSPIRLPNDHVKAVAFDHRQSLWIGTLDGLLRVDFDGVPKFAQSAVPEWSVQKIVSMNEKQGLHDSNVTCLYADPTGDFWVGTNSGRLYRYLPESEKLENIPVPEELTWLRTIVRDTVRNHLWLGGSIGFFCYDLTEKKYLDNSWLSPVDRAVYASIHEGEIWIGHPDGVFVGDLANKTHRRFQKSLNDTASISNNLLTDLLAYENQLWLSTFGGGLNLFENGRFTSFEDSQGNFNNNIWCIYPDENGRFWMSTDDGVLRLDSDRKTFHKYDEGDGFNFNDFSIEAHGQSPHGELLFGNPRGLNIFSPDHFETNTFLPPTLITDIAINYKSLEPTQDGAMEKIAAATKKITLKPEDKALTIRFSALNFRNPRKNSYAVKMEGFDKDWVVKPATERHANYTGLPAGTYTFRVKASNDNGLWNDDEAQLQIVVLPPFYETWWFKLTAFLCGVVLIAGTVLWYNRRKYLKRIQRLEVQHKLQMERERISKDLHDSVGANLTRIITDLDLLSLSMERQKKENTKALLEGTRTFTRSTIQLLRDTIWAFHKHSYSLEEFADKVRAFLRYYLEDKVKWSLETNLAQNRQLSPTEVLNLLRILQEATQNMLKHAQAFHFSVKINEGEQVEFTIKDDGIGLTEKGESLEEHYGMYNMRQRAEAIGGSLEVKSGNGLEIRVRL